MADGTSGDEFIFYSSFYDLAERNIRHPLEKLEESHITTAASRSRVRIKKERFCIRLEKNILEFFGKGKVSGYQTNINNALITYMNEHPEERIR